MQRKQGKKPHVWTTGTVVEDGQTIRVRGGCLLWEGNICEQLKKLLNNTVPDWVVVIHYLRWWRRWRFIIFKVVEVVADRFSCWIVLNEDHYFPNIWGGVFYNKTKKFIYWSDMYSVCTWRGHRMYNWQNGRPTVLHEKRTRPNIAPCTATHTQVPLSILTGWDV